MTTTEDDTTPATIRHAPVPGQQVLLRGHPWVVAEVLTSTLPPAHDDPLAEPQHLVSLVSLDDDRYEEELQVIWEIEPGARVQERASLPEPDPERLDTPDRLDAFLDAIRWGAVTSADKDALQAPFRSGITIEDYQLDPLVRALRMPRVNLLIADDVGLGKTIEAGLVVQELLLRHRARTVLIVVPASLQLKWQEEMAEKFGLDFEIVNTDYLRQLRRQRGIRANPWTSQPRLITSIDWLKRPERLKLLRDVLPLTPTYPRTFDLLIVDEVHNSSPTGRGKYVTDSQRTEALRAITPHFEHRLFLSATPHNGFKASWTALLELLDPQRFARGVEPDEEKLRQVMVRRLKSQLREELPPNEDGTPRFPKRVINALPVDYPESERAAHADLVAYAKSRSEDDGSSPAHEFVFKLLKKRLFSSPAAFRQTLGVHRETLRGRRSADRASSRVVDSAFRRIDEEEFATEDEQDEATRDALDRAAEAVELSATQDELLGRLGTWAEGASQRPDAKATELLEWLEATCRRGLDLDEEGWNRERVIIFTEYRDTQKWLADLITARDLGGPRLQLLFGGQDEDEREAIKAAFQADPELDPVRILLATDTASEGIDLQRQCNRLVHYEIPWNPNRLEQRNGRIDRHGQRKPEALIHHFVGRTDGDDDELDADLEFLDRVIRKIDTIREDLGSAGQVIADQVEARMSGRRRDFDEGEVDRRRAERRLTGLERDLRERIARLHGALEESVETLGLGPDRVERVVTTALDLDLQPPLNAVELQRDGEPVEGRCFAMPRLTDSWAASREHGLLHPVTGEERPITFDHELAAGHDDVVLVHLGHPLVQKSLRLLRAEVWADHNPRLARVTAKAVPDEFLQDDALIVHGRLVITGESGSRLHEEVIAAGVLVRDGKFNRLNVGQVTDALEHARAELPSGAAIDRVLGQWPAAVERIESAFRRRASDRADQLATTLSRRADEEADGIRQVLEELREHIEGQLAAPEFEQLRLELEEENQRDQLTRDTEALERRLQQIPEEIERETANLRRRYETPTARQFPAAVTVLVPESRV